MERVTHNLRHKIDWLTVILYALLVTLGWLNIFAAVYSPATDPGAQFNIFSTSLNSGKQLIWIGGAAILILIILITDVKVFYSFSYPVYGLVMVTLVGVLLFGREVAGSKSWFELGFARFQPSELAKFATALALARFLGDPTKKIQKISVMVPLLMIIGLPVALILLQKDTGSALVYTSFVLVFYREGLSGYIMLLGLFLLALFIGTLVLQEHYLYLVWALAGIGAISFFLVDNKLMKRLAVIGVVCIGVAVVFSVDFFVKNVLKPHQQERIKILIDPDSDPRGVGWQVTQSKIAIGSGGLLGKGFLEGTQTKFDFVPDQSTDFIFCTIGEEHGWMGSLALLGLFVALLTRLVTLAERQKTRYSRIYGYAVVAILFFHFVINIGMTIGLFPVIGIPLPFFSYGGSSLWSFTVLLFVMIKLDTQRKQLIIRD